MLEFLNIERTIILSKWYDSQSGQGGIIEIDKNCKVQILTKQVKNT